jgi:glycosyltransferase involved in cell wall biosynthesis
VLWSGALGGAETFTVDLSRTMHSLGAEVGVVFITSSGPLSVRVEAAALPQVSLEFQRGRQVTYHPRALARVVTALGPDGALLPGSGYLAAALRAGGYSSPIIGVVHDALVGLHPVSLREWVARRIDHASGRWATDIDVAVSDFALSHLRRQRRRRRLVRIYNGVDLQVYSSGRDRRDRSGVTIASACRLIEGKGIDVLLRAFAESVAGDGARLRIAGDGSKRPMLESLALDLGLQGAVEFSGSVLDMPSFWRDCDIAVQPSDTFIESFGMVSIEAMACARPVVATANGALPEVVEDGVTGIVVPPGDVRALSDALGALSRDGARRCAAGVAGRVRCEERFDIRDCASAYLRLFQERSRRPVEDGRTSFARDATLP